LSPWRVITNNNKYNPAQECKLRSANKYGAPSCEEWGTVTSAKRLRFYPQIEKEM
jgi:hypothetical protein